MKTPVRTRNPFLKTACAGLAITALFSACMQDAVEDAEYYLPSERRLFVYGTTYEETSKGVLISLNADSMGNGSSPNRRGPDSLPIYHDSRVFVRGGSVYVLERFGADNLLKYNPVSGKVVYQVHLGDGANPSDFLIREDGTAIVSLADSPKLMVVDTATGKTLRSVDFSTYAHVPDSAASRAGYSPHAFALAQTGDTLLVGLQRRNSDWMQYGELSVVLVLDAKTLAVRDTLQAPAYNASNLWVTDDAIFFACQGRYDSLDGGLYRWTRGTGSFATLFTEDELEGNVNDIACNEAGTCLISSYGRLDISVTLRSFSSDDGALGARITGFAQPTGGLLWDARQKVFYVGERDALATGLVRLGADLKPVGNKIPLGLPPANFDLYERQ